MKIIGIVQARLGSTRFPGKVLHPIDGEPAIKLLLGRLALASRLDAIVLATSDSPGDERLAKYVENLGYTVHRGSERDVLRRYFDAAQRFDADAIVRVTGDCPLIDPQVVDQIVGQFQLGGADYVSNVSPASYPDGLDTEVFTFSALERANRNATTAAHREHVTSYIRESGDFHVSNVAHSVDYSSERWTIDEPEDVELVEQLFRHFSPRRDFTWLEAISAIRSGLFRDAPRRKVKRNEGAVMNTGQKLWKRAKRVIPGGNMMLSKRAEMFLPDHWPAYFSRAKGCRVWDLDGRELIDMSYMGIGTNSLGYGQPEVDDAVRGVIEAGNLSTLNCPEEVYLAERLVELHPWAHMARFARSGGEANAIAVRIARAATGKDTVAICGYHGWHDWYLSANLADEGSLGGHLLPGLEPNGVPQGLRGTVLPFSYNRFDELQALVDNHDIGVIKMEVVRNLGPEGDFLQRVRRLATERGIVLIFDECTSGFRQTFGGIHKMYEVEPDMAMFGKTLGNGYAIAATIGKREIMEAAQTSFISSTFWTERIGSVAALKTLEVMERTRSWDLITETGRGITSRWQALAERHGVSISTSGIPALTSFAFDSPNALAFKTLLTQEMLAKGFLAGTSVYTCTEHTPELVDQYFDALDSVFALVRECEDGRDVLGLLRGPVAHGGFRRLN